MRILQLISFLLCVHIVLAQDFAGLASIELYEKESASELVKDLPDGLYESFDAFKNKRPSSDTELTKKVSDGGAKFNFYHGKKNKKIKRAFCVVMDGKVFFQTKMMLRNTTHDSYGQSWDGGPYFIKAKVVGQYLFMEDNITPANAAFMGGLIAVAATRQVKPIIFVEHLKKFRVVKSFKHFKDFILNKYPDYVHLVGSKQEMRAATGLHTLADVVEEILSQIH